MLRDLFRHRDLLWLLTVREVRVRYARAFLGILWAVFLPLGMMLLFQVLNFGRMMDPAESTYGSLPYPVFAYIGLIGWAHFATSLMQGTPSLLNARDMLRKSAFPREVIPLAKVFAAVLDLLVGATLLLYLLWQHREALPAPGTAWLALPVVLLLQVAFTGGVILLTSSLNMLFRDVNYLVQAITPLAMFATSVVYEARADGDAHPLVQAAFDWNPMSSILDGYREILLRGEWPWQRLGPGFVGTVIAVLVGTTVFRSLSRRFAEEV